MYCTNCGKELTGTETFCPCCGARQTLPPDSQHQAADTHTAAPDARTKKAKRSPKPQPADGKHAPAKHGMRWIVLGLAAAVLLVFALDAVLANRQREIPDPAAFFGLTWENGRYTGSYDYSYHKTAPSGMQAETALAAMQDYTLLLHSDGIEASVEDKRESRYNRTERIIVEADLGRCSLFDVSRLTIRLAYYLPEQRFFLELPYGKMRDRIDFTPIDPYVTGEDIPADTQNEAPADAQAAPEPASSAAPEPEAAPASSQTPPPVITGPTVPDFQAFCGSTLHVHEITEYLDYTEYVYFWKYNEKAMNEYLTLLKDAYHFKLRAKYSVSSIDSYRYAFDYTGPGSAGTYDEDGMDTDADGENISLYLWDLAGEVHICVADGFDYKDTGDRTTRKITPYESTKTSTKSSSVPSSRSSPKVLDCLTCGGDGDCPECNGYGTVKIYGGGGDFYNTPCSRCYGSRKCPSCGGSGKR